MSLRVLVLNERDPAHPGAGGAEEHVSQIFRRLVARGHRVTLACAGFEGAAPRDRFHGVEVRRLGPLAAYYPRVAWYCARATHRGEFDVTVECLNRLVFCAPLSSRAPVLGVCHHMLGEAAFLQASWPIAATVRCAERLIPSVYRRTPIVCISESTRDDLIQRGIPAENLRVSQCGVVRPGVPVRPPSVRPARIVVLGRLVPAKRVDLVLRAVACLGGRFPDLQVDVIGRGLDRLRLSKLAAKLGIAQRIHFAGFVDSDRRDRMLAEARVSVCPSVKEGWALAAMEASAVGTPVVAADAPGLRDSVRDGRTGFLVPGDCAEAFAHRITRLLEDDRLADRMSQASIAWASRFDWDRTAEEMHGFLTGVARA